MPFLVVLQVALACAIACNALFLLQQRLKPILTPDGIGEPSHLIIASKIISRGKPWETSRLRDTERALRGLPGVASVSVAGSLPMVTNARMNGRVQGVGHGTRADTAMYIGDHLVKTLDLKLVAGRDFTAEEDAVRNHGVGMRQDGPVILTRSLADKLFPDQKAVGQTLQLGDKDPAVRTVVGVVAHLMRNDFGGGAHRNLDHAMLFPSIPSAWPLPSIGIRVAAGADPQQVRKQAENVIQRMLGDGMVRGIDPAYDMYGALRDQALARYRASVWLLAGVCLVVLIVTLAGIMGLTAYWVQQRTRQIGIRRALGATRRSILRDLQAENFLLVGFGSLLGLMAAYGVNLWLMHHYELPRLPWSYLPVGAVLLLVLGQLAVLSPALRAARVPPVVATRSA
ncbi:ABC transporter [Oleiagrimonas sp. MCCC 1A03011]|nr:ABC transporter [Oleiagrimonas sp. MCCC 1A03011]